MAESFLGEVKIVSFDFPPKGWAFCNGQLLPINQNQALFSILGTTYGGNGQTNFALPNLQGRCVIGWGGSSGHVLGEAGGAETATLIQNQLPGHSHAVRCSTAVGDQHSPAGNVFAAQPAGGPAVFSNGANNATAQVVKSGGGGSQPHNNMQPYLVVNFVIALQGIFPSQN